MAGAVLCLHVALVLDAASALPFLARQERDALVYTYAIKGLYTAAEIAAILAAVHGFHLRSVLMQYCSVCCIGDN